MGVETWLEKQLVWLGVGWSSIFYGWASKLTTKHKWTRLLKMEREQNDSFSLKSAYKILENNSYDEKEQFF